MVLCQAERIMYDEDVSNGGAMPKREMPELRPGDEDALRPVIKGLLRSEMTKRNMTYKDLHEALSDLGVEEDERNLRNKIARGSFSATFLLQCLWAMNILTFETGMGLHSITPVHRDGECLGGAR